jgi:hypothetical protein
MNQDHSDQPARRSAQPQTVRQVLLPSGRTVEVVRLHDPKSDSRMLSDCPSCGSDLVQPQSWSQTADGRWNLLLECPNCWSCEAGTFSRTQVERLEDHLDEGLTAMISDLQRIALANVTAEIERFARALQADQILPEDF